MSDFQTRMDYGILIYYQILCISQFPVLSCPPPPLAGTQTTSSSSTLRHFSLITQRVVHINVWFCVLVNSCLCKNGILIETLHAMTLLHDCYFIIACEQAHRALWRRVGKGRSTCNYVSLIWISASKKSMQNADLRSDDVSNDIITLGMCFSLFVYICARFCFVLIGGNLTTQSMGRHGNWRWNSNSRDVVGSSPSFSRPTTRVH